MIETLQQLWQRTKEALDACDLDPNDRNAVLRYEKLSKLLLSINRQLKQLGAEATEVEIEV